MRFIGVALIVVCLALISVEGAAASRTQDELARATLNLNEIAPYLNRGGQIPVAERQRGSLAAPVANYEIRYDRGIAVLVIGNGTFTFFLEGADVLLVDGSAGTVASTLLRFDCKCVGVRTDHAPPAIGEDTAWYTLQDGPLMYDVITWRHLDVLARIVVRTTIGISPYPPIAVPDIAAMQQAKLATSFPTPPPAPVPSSTTAPAPPPTRAPAPVSPPAQPTVQLREVSGVGTLLTDAQGMTLYTSDRDLPGDSACLDVCAATWPPLTLEQGNPVAPEGLSGTLATITRADGRQQVTYNGRPLYRCIGDSQPADMIGDGFDGAWHVVVVTPAAAPE